ncbi:unnamed protein product [Parnassius apollo]|uniref:(apollo) hypothetical protein n=1 Tax=Parnassius apollo TaxID=110799 RepID=A0A8S3X405_PARAO|nr:unnamed protein product [Parnassius apollo]
MAALRDEDIEKELEMMFGLPEDPDDSEDGYEADDPDTNLNLTRVFEDEDLFEHQGSSASGPGLVPSPIPGTSLDENWENVSPNIERFERQSEDSPIRGPIRRRRVLSSEFSSSSENESQSETSADDGNDDEWKKIMWSAESRPKAEDYDRIPLKAKDFFPSRTAPIVYFSRFFSGEVINHIVEQTNLYEAPKKSMKWEPVTSADIKAFIGMIIIMGIHVLPSIDLYWSSDPLFRVNEVAEIMTCKRFKKILENLHLNDNSQIPSKSNPDYDKLYKVRPLLEMLNTACKNEARTSTSQSIDEAMIRFKEISSLKQYMPAKPIKRGFKVWVRADSSTGYVYEFQIYTGKNDDSTPEFGLGSNVVKSLSKSLIEEEVTVHLAFDNFFAS